jgi:CRISPR-associated protein Csm3
MQLESYIIIEGLLRWEGGRIGGQKESVEIAAATDNPIIRHPITGYPYIPGSSLKGKIRSLLELSNENIRLGNIDQEIKKIADKTSVEDAIRWATEEVEDAKRKNRRPDKRAERVKSLYKYKEGTQNGEPCGCGLETCLICKSFGPHKNTEHSLGPTRLIFRDAKMVLNREEIKNVQIPKDSYTLEEIKKHSQEKGLPYAEIKSENIINRHTGRASDPRQMERVIEGSLFKMEIVIRLFDGDKENELKNLLKSGIKLLEKDYLGGSGSRGYGKVKFYDMKINNQSWTELGQ